MPGILELNSPTETVMELMSPNDSVKGIPAIPNDDEPKERVKMKKELGLLEGCAIILGIIFGSGIFISPKGVIQEVNAPGTSLVIWTLCGLLSMIGALCYAELGCCIPKSGGDYMYINEAFGDLPSFLYIWDATVIFVPATNAIMSLTFANYVLQPFYYGECKVPELASQLLAAATIIGLTFLNSYNVKATTKMQNIIMFTKIAALVTIIIVGITYMALGHTENFDNAFENSETDPGKLAVAFYSGIFSYAGWNYLNFMTEELRDPYKNLPRAIYISLPLVTVIYVLANVAYLAVLTPQEMIASNAIAVTFGDKVLQYGSWIIPIMVAISAFGGLSVHIMTSSRMCFVAARNKHMPELLSFINVKRFTPTPSLVFLCLLSLLYLFIGDVYVLITYSSVVETFFIMLSVTGVLWFRYKQPDMPRPIKVNIIVPITFVIICIFLILVPIYQVPGEAGMGCLITLMGIPFYIAGVAWKNKRLAVGIKVFDKYLNFVRKLQFSYRLEPAGSQGVWSLDDYQFIPFIWGSAQLIGTEIEPAKFVEPETIESFRKDYMFISCIDYIQQVKTGHIAEHSNQLWSISAVQSWTKICTGLIKMYQKEVLSKFPVIQHVLFGSIFSLNPVKPGTRLPQARLGMPLSAHPLPGH